MNDILNKVNKDNSLYSYLVLTIFLFLMFGCNFRNGKESSGSNKIETYRATWWHLPYSNGISGDWGRPTYGVINIENDKLSLRHAILEGRELGDYRLPYWPIRSFVSIFSNTVEVTHRGSADLTIDNQNRTFPFRCGDSKYNGNSMRNKRIEEGFELAHYKNADVLKVSNKGSESPVLMEHFFIVEKGSSDIPVFIKTTNITDKTINDVVAKVSYSQDFNWSTFGLGSSRGYTNIVAPVSGKAEAFFAFSAGMEKGFEFNINEGCELSYTLDQEFNAWNVSINNTSTTLEPGTSVVYSYNLRIINKPSEKIVENKFISLGELDLLEFKNVIPAEVKTAPVNIETRVTIDDVIKNIDTPKVRGLHRITGLPKAFDDLALLKEWGGNLAVTQGNPEDIRQIIEHGHSLDIEMFVPGVGSYNTGIPPEFDQLFSANLNLDEFPDSYGQDEDHYYWYPVKATLDFEDEFGKPMKDATLEEKVTYWSRCFVNKWHKTLENVREHDPKGNIWFYMPTPSVANIDPFDYHDLFLKEITKLGDALTVFPFYYGIDFDQIEYMMRKWKDAGADRAVFLPGGPTYLKPSQFFRAITAARRGGADGACGFAFSITEEDFDDEWRWKSVMLASQANFPTLELDAYCFIEEPAELIEALAVSEVNVINSKSDSDDFTKKLEAFLPDKVKRLEELPENQINGQIYVVVGENTDLEQNKWVYNIQHLEPGKGVMQMSGNVVGLNGADITGIQNAKELFLRFAEMTKVENSQ